jgi:nicotinamidase-related amidase
MSRTALFVIDIQNDLATDPKTRIPHAQRIQDAGTQILAAARSYIDRHTSKSADKDSSSNSAPPLSIVFVQHSEPASSGALVAGSEPWQLVFAPRTTTSSDDDDDKTEMLVGKTTPDTFVSNRDLAEELRQQGVRRIVAFGIQSDYCVGETGKGALAAGFDVTLLRGAHSTYDSGGKTAEEIEREIEEELRGKGAKIVPWEEAVKEWNEG